MISLSAENTLPHCWNIDVDLRANIRWKGEFLKISFSYFTRFQMSNHISWSLNLPHPPCLFYIVNASNWWALGSLEWNIHTKLLFLLYVAMILAKGGYFYLKQIQWINQIALLSDERKCENYNLWINPLHSILKLRKQIFF